MRDSDIDSLSADGAQDTRKMAEGHTSFCDRDGCTRHLPLTHPLAHPDKAEGLEGGANNGPHWHNDNQDGWKP